MLFRGHPKVVQQSPMSAPIRSPDRSLDRVLRSTSREASGDTPKSNPRYFQEGSLKSFREGSLMRFREGSMRSFRELSRGSKIHSKHPKKRQHPPRSIPRHSRRTRASELEREPYPPPQGERHTSRGVWRLAGRKSRKHKESRPAGGKKGAGRVEKGTGEDEQAVERWPQEDRKVGAQVLGNKKLPIAKSYRELSVAGTGFEPATSGVCISF